MTPSASFAPTWALRSLCTALVLSAGVGSSLADQLKYSTGAVLDVNLGCSLKNGQKDQLIWTSASIKSLKAGRVPLKYLHAIGGNKLAFKAGVQNQTLAAAKFLADSTSMLTLSGPGLFDAPEVSGGGNLTTATNTTQVKLGKGSLGLVNAPTGSVTLNGTNLQGLIIGQKAVANDCKVVAASVSTGGVLEANKGSITTVTVAGKLSLSNECSVETATISTGGVLEATKGNITTLTVSGELSLSLQALPLSVGKLTVTAGTLSLKTSAPKAAGDVITLITNTGTAASPIFTGIPEGTIVFAAPVKPATTALTLKISYVGGSGNDVTATVQP